MTVPPATRRRPMIGRYLLQNRLAAAALQTIDVALGSWRAATRIAGQAAARSFGDGRSPDRILLAIGGHLGDAVMATAALAAVRRAWPNAGIGVLTASWNRPVLEGHGAVERLHLVDHWKLCRSGGRAANATRYRSMARAAIAEIRGVGYDVAIDLYPFYPNMGPVLYRAGIPMRVGYSSGGFGPLFTHVLDWYDDRAHITEKQRQLLALAFPGREHRLGGYDLPPTPPGVAEAVATLHGSLHGPIVVLHPGAGAPHKQWQPDAWAHVARALIGAGYDIAITGMGARDRNLAHFIVASAPGARSLVDQLDWQQFVACIDAAALVVSVDTVAGHIAAARHRPFLTLFTGVNAAAEFRPLGVTGEVMMHEVTCAPCFIGAGCDDMACIAGLTPERVLDRAMLLLKRSE